VGNKNAMKKKCHVHAPSIYGGEFMGGGLLWLRFGYMVSKSYMGVRGCKMVHDGLETFRC
jgi:hypothetical protein